MITEFVIREWAAWAPALAERAQWLAWASADSPSCPASADDAPTLAAMPAMSRRRLNLLGRMAAQVAYELADDSVAPDARSQGTPMIYASRYGDASRSLALLADLVRGDPISPTAFGLSVHNAIGAMVSIARADRAHHSALAGGASSAGAALIEAAGLLADGEDSVIVVHYDAPLPGDYAAFANEPATPYAWAWRLARPQPGEPCVRLELDADDGASMDPADADLPFGLALLRFGLSGRAHWRRNADGHCWRWSHSRATHA